MCFKASVASAKQFQIPRLVFFTLHTEFKSQFKKILDHLTVTVGRLFSNSIISLKT